MKKTALHSNVTHILCETNYKILFPILQLFKRHSEKVSEMRNRCEQIMTSSSLTDPIQAANNVQLMGQIEELCQAPTNFTINDKSYIQYQYEHGLQKFVESVSKLGSIQCDHSLPSLIKYDIPEGVVAGIKFTVNVTVKSLKGEPLGNCPITAKITDPEDDELSHKMSTGTENNGLYSFEVRPQMSGTHKISLHFLDIPIWGQETEFEVESNDPVSYAYRHRQVTRYGM